MKQTQVKIAYISPASLCIQRLVEQDEQLLNSAASFKPLRRKTYLSGRGLLKLSLIEQGVLGSDDPLPQLKIGSSGKPYIGKCLDIALVDSHKDQTSALCCAHNEQDTNTQSQVHFNISHSLDVIALSTGNKDQGIDLEVANIKRLRKPLLERVLNRKELDYYSKLTNDHERAVFFAQQWTLREALIKLTGISIFQMDVLVIDPYKHTIVSSKIPAGMVYCFKLPKAAGSSRNLNSTFHNKAESARSSQYSDALCKSELDEILNTGIDEPLDAVLSVFVHQEDLDVCQREGIEPVSIRVQQELAFKLGLLMNHDGAQMSALNGATAHKESLLYDDTGFCSCNLAVYTAFAVNPKPD